MKRVPFEPLDPGLYREIVRRALAEDLGWGDVTTDATVPPSRARGVILAKSPASSPGSTWRRRRSGSDPLSSSRC